MRGSTQAVARLWPAVAFRRWSRRAARPHRDMKAQEQLEVIERLARLERDRRRSGPPGWGGELPRRWS